MDCLEKNFYGPGNKDILLRSGSGTCFRPSDARDHIATPFFHLYPPIPSNPWLIIELIFSRENFESFPLCPIVIQDSSFNQIEAFDFTGECIQKNPQNIFISYEIPEDITRFRLVFNPLNGKASLMPGLVRILQTGRSDIETAISRNPQTQKYIHSRKLGQLRRLPHLDERILCRELKGIALDELTNYFAGDPWTLNYLKNAWEFVHKKTDLTSYPCDQAFAIGGNCNANCTFCLTRRLRARYRDEFMDPERWYQFRHILKYARTVGIPGPGEPLLHPEFRDLIRNLSLYIDPRCAIYLITNGILIDRFLDFFENSPIKTFNISLNAASSETHARVMRVNPETFDRVIKNIQGLVHLRAEKRQNITINLTFIAISENLHEVPEFISLGNQLQVDGIFIRPFTIECGRDRGDADYLSLEPTNNQDFGYHFQRALAAIAGTRVPVYAKPDTWINRLNHTVPHDCTLLYKNLYLSNEFNRFWPCCIIGEMDNVHPIPYDGSDDFMAAWNSPTMVNLRKSLLSGPLNDCCKTCNIDLYL